MSGMAQRKIYYQGSKETDKKPVPVWNGEENRDKSSRPELTPGEQFLLNEVREIKACRSGCFINQKYHQHVNHAFGAIEEVGDGNIPNGINKSRDTIKKMDARFEFEQSLGKKALQYLIVFIVGAVMTLIILGFKTEMGG